MIITSPKGKEMFETISPIYYQSRLMQAIIQATGHETDRVYKIADEILLQLFPQTATWGLRYWEELLEIPVNEKLPIERRRAVVMTRLKSRSPMTPLRMANIIKSLTNEQAEYIEVTENVEPHVFMVLISTRRSGIDYANIYKTIKKIKPSHESFYLGNSYLRSFSLSKRKIYGFSKIIHAIGTFVCSKEDTEFMATKGYRNTGDIAIKKNKIHGTSDPLVISKELVSIIEGFLNDDLVEQSSEIKRGNSSPLVCSKKLKFTRIEVV